MIDTRHGNSMHSWDLGIKGECSDEEIAFMNLLISNRRKHIFGTHQDGKALTLEQIKTFYNKKGVVSLINGLLEKGYLKEEDDKYNPVCGNMSFEVFKFLDPKSISITLTASDSNRLGIYYNKRIRRLTPRECARLQGYPEGYVLHPIDSVAYKQFGNAVSVPVVQALLEDYFENNKSSLLKMAKKKNTKTPKVISKQKAEA
jgi:DNA (cytosine-5)-methyltransferase 1